MDLKIAWFSIHTKKYEIFNRYVHTIQYKQQKVNVNTSVDKLLYLDTVILNTDKKTSDPCRNFKT